MPYRIVVVPTPCYRQSAPLIMAFKGEATTSTVMVSKADTSCEVATVNLMVYVPILSKFWYILNIFWLMKV